MQVSTEKYIEIAKQTLSKKRFHHTLCVAEEAKRLAKMYDADLSQAEIAGLLHDICKETPFDQQLQWIRKSDIILESTTLSHPKVWHGIAASVYMFHELKISDPEILNAVRYHTTARADMSKMEKIVYLADLISEDRSYPGLDEMRGHVNQSLEIGMKEALCYIVEDMIESRYPLVEDTVQAYNFYLKY